MDERIDEILEWIENALESRHWDCLVGRHFSIEGRDYDAMKTMADSMYSNCFAIIDPNRDWEELVISVDTKGKVIEVRALIAMDPPFPESIECVRDALIGLNFPCLANYEICPKYYLDDG